MERANKRVDASDARGAHARAARCSRTLADHARARLGRPPGRAAPGARTRSCSSASTPARNSIAELSIPRDLRVDDPRPRRRPHQRGLHARRPGARDQDRAGPDRHPDQPRRARRLRGLPRSSSTRSAASRSTTPTKIISNSFDGHPWRFGRGRLHLDGRHALAYARVRENTANPSDNDLTRGLRQQRVLQAIAARPGLAGHAASTCRASATHDRQAAHDRPLGRRPAGARLASDAREHARCTAAWAARRPRSAAPAS